MSAPTHILRKLKSFGQSQIQIFRPQCWFDSKLKNMSKDKELEWCKLMFERLRRSLWQRRIENRVKARLHNVSFGGNGQLNTPSLSFPTSPTSHKWGRLDDKDGVCDVWISQQLLWENFERLRLYFSLSQPLQPTLLCIWSIFVCLFCTFQRILPFFLPKCAFWRSKCRVIWVKQTSLALFSLFFPDTFLTIKSVTILADCETVQTGWFDRRWWWTRFWRLVGELSITIRATLKLANLHINHSDYLYDQHHDDHQVDHPDHHTELQYHEGDHDECPRDRHHVHLHLVKSQHNLKTCELARKKRSRNKYLNI